MNPIRCISRLLIVAAFLVPLGSMAHGDILLNYQYSGEIVDVDDPFGAFGQNQIGDPFNGNIKLCNGSFLGDLDGIAEYSVDVVGQPNQFNTFAAGQFWQPTPDYVLHVVGPATGFAVGIDFQFELDPSMLDLSGLPIGTNYAGSGLLVGLNSSDLNFPTSYPDLPSSLQPLSDYDMDRLFLMYMIYFDSSSQTYGVSSLSGEITSLNSVPEPAMGIVFAGLIVGTISTIRMRIG